jgi:arginyl-tRNA synthetase
MTRLLAAIKEELTDFNVRMDSFRSEKDLVAEGKMQESLRLLKEKGSIYEKDGALWFKASAYGDEKDRVLRKSDGELTYLASDIAYHREKFRRGFETLIDFWGPDHHGYIARLRGALAALGDDPGAFKVIIVQHCTLWEGKKSLSMSTRAGEFVSLRQVMDEVGKDAARYFFVRRRKESHLDFDLELARRRSNDNPVFYVQYAHARINSIFRKYRERFNQSPPDPRETDLERLSEPAEMEVLKQLARFPELVRSAALTSQPHLLPSYLEELAAVFHGYYTRHRVIGPEQELTAARLALARAVQQVLAEGLDLLGVSAPEKM